MNVQQMTREFKAEVREVKHCLIFLERLAETLETHPTAYHFQLYPTMDGKGGSGITATVYFTESYAAIDCWGEEKYVHLNIVSCKHFSERAVETVINWFQAVLEAG